MGFDLQLSENVSKKFLQLFTIKDYRDQSSHSLLFDTETCEARSHRGIFVDLNLSGS
jgi:hypothetical protein